MRLTPRPSCSRRTVLLGVSGLAVGAGLAVSGIGRAPAVYEQACRGAPLGEGLAIRGEEADAALREVRDWLTRVHLLNEN
jgi:hypothetical protein